MRFALAGLLLVMPLMAPAEGEKKPPSEPNGVEASLEWGRRVALATPTSGVVSEVLVKVGDRVTEGQELLHLDPRRFDAEVTRARAEVKRHELAREEAKLELDRAKELRERTVLSAHDLQQARIDFASAEAALAAARAELVRAQVDRDESVVRSPMDGVVVQRRVERGQTVVNKLQVQPLVVVAQDTPMRARARLGPEDIAKLRVGQKLRVLVSGVSHDGTVAELGLEPVEEFGMPEYLMVVEFSPAAASGPLRAGQTVKVLLP